MNTHKNFSPFHLVLAALLPGPVLALCALFLLSGALSQSATTVTAVVALIAGLVGFDLVRTAFNPPVKYASPRVQPAPSFGNANHVDIVTGLTSFERSLMSNVFYEDDND